MKNPLEKHGAVIDLRGAGLPGLAAIKGRVRQKFAGMSRMVACFGLVWAALVWLRKRQLDLRDRLDALAQNRLNA